MFLYGKQMTRRQVESYVGRLEQIGGVQRFVAAEGVRNGAEMIRVRTGGGLEFDICPSKGLDISLAQYLGTPISWQSPNGDVHPAYYDRYGTGWLRSASGGLLMTCGMTQAGAPNEDDGEALGLHGRLHHTPASQVAAGGNWVGDDYEIKVSGVLEETEMFGTRLVLHREYHCRLGENRVYLRDTIVNTGFKAAPLMMLYHFNFGFPLMSDDTRVCLPHADSRPRIAGLEPDGYVQWGKPQTDYEERVYYHAKLQSNDEWASVAVHNPAFPVGSGTQTVKLFLDWKTDTLPNLVQWKLLQSGMYVLGLEPANCWVDGRQSARADGSLQFLQPGEQVTNELKFELSTET